MSLRSHPEGAAVPKSPQMSNVILREMGDAALVVAIGRWRQDALAEAFRRHAGAVHGLARRVLSDDSLAEEVVQEIFLRLWNSPDRFDPDRGSLRSFLLAHAHGRAVDLLLSDVSRRRREEKDARSTAEAGYDIEHEVWDLAVADHVKDAVAGRRRTPGAPPRPGTTSSTRSGTWRSPTT